MTAAGPSAAATHRARDGTALAYRVLAAGEPRAAILMLHGWSDHQGRWLDTAEALRAAGYTVVLLDSRGHGRSAGRRGHFVRFSQLLADLHGFRRSVMAGLELPEVLFGHSFGGLVVLRYLETDPDLPVAAAVVSSPYLGLALDPPRWKLILARLLSDVAGSVPFPAGIASDAIARDPAVNAAFRADSLVHNRITASAWREILRGQALTLQDAERITIPVLFLIAGDDRLVDPVRTLELAGRVKGPAAVRQYDEMYHETLHDPERHRVMEDILAFLQGAVPDQARGDDAAPDA